MSIYRAEAEAILRETGSRTTRGRVVVLASLLDATHALTHSEVLARVGKDHDIDRVTVYRVLDWLTKLGIVHRISSTDRIWRFTAEAEQDSGAHPHFRCDTCGNVVCLGAIGKIPRIALPAGFRADKVELTVNGSCVHCLSARKTTLIAKRRGTTRK